MAACGSDAATGDSDAFSIVVTTSIHGDIVRSALGDAVPDAITIDVVMPAGADPHDFSASAKQAELMENAGLLVTNGLDLEAGLDGIIDAVADTGTPVFAFSDHLDVLSTSDEDHADEDHADEDHADEDHADEDHADEDHADEDHADEDHADEDHADEDHADEDHEDHADEDHADEDHDDEDHDDEDHDDEDHDDHDGHDHGGVDPHLWTDPAGLIPVLEALRAELTTAGVDSADIDESLDAYIARLETLDAEIETILAPIPDDQRVLVTNHDAFGYFANRYGFEVIGTVIPSLTTNAEVSPAALDDLAELMRDRSVTAVFAENTESDQLASALADEVGGGVQVVELFSGSLGPSGSGAEDYISMMTTNAELIAEALAP
ncbi:putative metal ABC transporter metal-binding protein [Ilumatobacter coccineus YM16-304]|uniref:Putative metal ABC transporter metal-binding protein n=1 Tax=Ilumatobacter coccineus (strain NBRC 103263 / KCTC 29153 / YM16-304) TaxID=1313172 RepID=A0A6C7ECZ7_ILUCY|nr:putative metal ABC transporter metal-binding protein [Ilumatobacter coccineus YM16-304]